MSVNININFDEDYIAKKVKKVKKISKNFLNSSIRKYVHFLQEKDKIVIIPYVGENQQAIDSLKEVDVHFLNNDKIFCNRSIGAKCPVCDVVEDLRKSVMVNEDIKKLYDKLSPKSYVMVPIVLLGAEKIDDAVKYTRWQLPMYEKFMTEYISNRDYGTKCLKFEIGFELYQIEKNEYKFLDIEPFQVEKLKFDIDDILNKFKSLPDPYKILIEGLGYNNNTKEISQNVKNFLNTFSSEPSTTSIVTKNYRNSKIADEEVEIKSNEILSELNDNTINKIFDKETQQQNKDVEIIEKSNIDIDSILDEL